MVADVENSRIAMDPSSYIYQPMIPDLNEEDENEFEAVEAEILKRALKNSKFLLPRIDHRDFKAESQANSS